MIRTILIVLLVLIVIGLIPFHDGYYGYGLGGAAGLIILILVILLLTGDAKLPVWLIAASMAAMMLAGCNSNGTVGGSDRVVAHEESDKAHWLDGGRTKSESTTVVKPDGAKVTESKSVTTPPPPAK